MLSLSQKDEYGKVSITWIHFNQLLGVTNGMAHAVTISLGAAEVFPFGNSKRNTPRDECLSKSSNVGKTIP